MDLLRNLLILDSSVPEDNIERMQPVSIMLIILVVILTGLSVFLFFKAQKDMKKDYTIPIIFDKGVHI